MVCYQKEITGKEREKKGREQKGEKMERPVINITIGAPFKGRFKVDAGGATPLFYHLRYLMRG